jgi:hydroxyacylglutathione hydrolase
MTTDALMTAIESGTAPTIIDVRSRWEFEAGHVPGARHFPFWNIAAHADEISRHQTDEVVVYCGHGPRAQWAAGTLRRCGFDRVRLLEGHWAQWLHERRPRE